MAKQTLASVRDAVIREIVSEEVEAYINGVRLRPCACCGRRFKPKMRYHFLCRDACRRLWYRGVFRPRTGD